MIDLNVRAVKRRKDSDRTTYTISVGRSLCVHCARQSACPTLKSLKRLNSKAPIIAKIDECADYAYPILFADTKGTQGEFNTMRLGTAWVDRVGEGDIVGLINKEGKVFGYAEVVDAFAGEKEWVIRDYAYENHLYVDSGMTHQEAGVDLLKRLPNIYGNMIVNNNKMMTAIYLKNIS